ncbi:hypothetical protein SAMN05660649_05017 [Desulfotomaculum arcticum]|uniref:Uncharacterized protein n=1 Tax=Desulfotruncus arcticus DSM 17038 TaxID=1121424 RepID=A0A1I2ZMS1_9FIRM|nr:hypothetical protein [Desulfotruncus arcticus]SFH38916.1 hypothetical protein SAMN05660649_05017 [Desulfotomaculum arcticum] [Desulfotruncus arcticus DSM 17038]
MSKPMLLIQRFQEKQESDEEKQYAGEFNDLEIIAIAIYGKDVEVPLPVVTQRVFDGEIKFKFPTEITAGAAKTRLVYRYTLPQWLELLEITTLPVSPAGLKQIMIPVLLYLKKGYPDIFSDVEYDVNFDPDQYAEIIPVQ